MKYTLLKMKGKILVVLQLLWEQ